MRKNHEDDEEIVRDGERVVASLMTLDSADNKNATLLERAYEAAKTRTRHAWRQPHGNMGGAQAEPKPEPKGCSFEQYKERQANAWRGK